MKKRKSAIDEMIWESSSDLGAHLEFWREGCSKGKGREGEGRNGADLDNLQTLKGKKDSLVILRPMPLTESVPSARISFIHNLRGAVSHRLVKNQFRKMLLTAIPKLYINLSRYIYRVRQKGFS